MAIMAQSPTLTQGWDRVSLFVHQITIADSSGDQQQLCIATPTKDASEVFRELCCQRQALGLGSYSVVIAIEDLTPGF